MGAGFNSVDIRTLPSRMHGSQVGPSAALRILLSPTMKGTTRVPVLGFLSGQIMAGRVAVSSTKLAVFWQTVGHVRQMDFGVLGVYRWVVSKGDVTH